VSVTTSHLTWAIVLYAGSRLPVLVQVKSRDSKAITEIRTDYFNKYDETSTDNRALYHTPPIQVTG